MSSPPPSIPPAASASAAASASPPRSPLYRDALTSVLAFLSLGELAAAIAVNNEWAAAVHSMRPALLPADISCNEFAALVASPSLRRHVAELGKADSYGYRLKLPSPQLSLLVSALPHLLSLTVCVNAMADEVLFPPRLEQLNVSLDEKLYFDENTTALLASISRLSRLHKLRLNFRSAVTFIAPLQQLPLLRDLNVSVRFEPFLEQFAAELRALPLLHRLRVDGQATHEHRTALLHALLGDDGEEQPLVLRWRDFSIAGLLFSDELTPLLLRLPWLERLDARLKLCRSFEFLSALPRLTSLELEFHWIEDVAWGNLLAVFTFNGLARLRTLSLRGGPCGDDEMKTLLSHTPSLTSLILAQLSQVRSLSFFLHLPKLAESLTHLTVDCIFHWRLTAADLPQLLVLHQLRELRLIGWPSEDANCVTAADRAPFEQRPCVVLPHLELFQWTLL